MLSSAQATLSSEIAPVLANLAAQLDVVVPLVTGSGAFVVTLQTLAGAQPLLITLMDQEDVRCMSGDEHCLPLPVQLLLVQGATLAHT